MPPKKLSAEPRTSRPSPTNTVVELNQVCISTIGKVPESVKQGSTSKTLLTNEETTTIPRSSVNEAAKMEETNVPENKQPQTTENSQKTAVYHSLVKMIENVRLCPLDEDDELYGYDLPDYNDYNDDLCDYDIPDYNDCNDDLCDYDIPDYNDCNDDLCDYDIPDYNDYNDDLL